jgi:hypothetical protein
MAKNRNIYKKDKTADVFFKISEDLKAHFMEYCKKNGYSISGRIRVLMENDSNFVEKQNK